MEMRYQVDIKAHSGNAVYDVHRTPDEINNIWNENESILLGSMMFNEIPMKSNNIQGVFFTGASLKS